jgi:hypothetical protein
MSPLEFRRGREEIQKVVEERNSSDGGSFTPFLPNIYWKDDKEEKYLLFLNDIDSIPRLDLITFIPDGNHVANVIAHTDQVFGESSDPFIDKWDATAREMNIAIAVELEPKFELVEGRKRPRGFEVATREFDRKVRDEDGEATDETEEVTVPVVGVIVQSTTNFFAHIEAYDASDAPIHSTPIRVKRIGKGTNTSYNVDGFPDQKIDLTNLIEYIPGISYLDKDEIEAIVEDSENQSPEETALVIGSVLLEKHLQELADQERYERLLDNVTESLDKFGKNKKKEKKPATRSTRPSQRRSAEAEEPKEAKEEVTQDSPAKSKLEEIRAKAEAKRAAKGDS